MVVGLVDLRRIHFGSSTLSGGAIVVALACAACGNKTDLPPGSGDCKACTTGATTSGGTTTTGGTYRDATVDDAWETGGEASTGPDAGPVAVMFNVGSTNDTGFISVSPYNGTVRVSAVGASGDIVTTGDITSGEGSLDGVPTGPNWFAVQDPAGSDKVLPTLQPVAVNPTTPAAALVAVTASQLKPLMIDQQPWVPLKGHATLIVIFNRGGRLLSGISIGPSLPAGASVAYEQNGMYLTPMNNPDIMTDMEGTAIVRDLGNVSTYPMTTILKFGYRLGTAVLSFEATVATDFVTWMTVAVP
jgi:hypothetical protein